MAALTMPVWAEVVFREPLGSTDSPNAFFRFPTGNPQSGQATSRAFVTSLQSCGQILSAYLASAGATFTTFGSALGERGSGSTWNLLVWSN